jgi:tRNA threonylcarbamoyladenosine biosynthesis protein TsaE
VAKTKASPNRERRSGAGVVAALSLATRRDTRLLARSIARVLDPGDLLLLSGDLGAGKTFLVRSLVRAFGGRERVTSPTFVLVHDISTPRGPLVHADLYRLRDAPEGLAREIARLGLRESRGEGARVVVEWGEAAEQELGAPSLVVKLAIVGPHARIATLSGPKAFGIVG